MPIAARATFAPECWLQAVPAPTRFADKNRLRYATCSRSAKQHVEVKMGSAKRMALRSGKSTAASAATAAVIARMMDGFRLKTGSSVCTTGALATCPVALKAAAIHSDRLESLAAHQRAVGLHDLLHPLIARIFLSEDIGGTRTLRRKARLMSDMDVSAVMPSTMQQYSLL